MKQYNDDLNAVLLRRKNKMILNKSELQCEIDATYLATILKNIESVGYTLSNDILQILATYSLEELEPTYKWLIKNIKKIKGADKVWKPMYPNFPKQVMEMEMAQLYWNARMHYFGKFVLGVTILPQYEKDERMPLIDITNLTVLGLGTESELNKIFSNIMTSKTSISEQDKKELELYLKHMPVSKIEIPTITYKEILATVYNTLLFFDKIPSKDISINFKTATDVLRLAVACSDGDISLACSSKFRNFKRGERRFLLNLIENCKTDIVEDMLKFKNVWLRLGEKIHPFEYKDRFPKCFTAFDIIRNNKAYSTFNSKVEKALLSDIDNATLLLKARPGELARRLDHLLRNAKRQAIIIKHFEDVVDQVSSPVLLQLMTHFENRCRDTKWNLRVFIPKGQMAKIQAVKNDLKDIPIQTCKNIILICRNALKKKYHALEKLGNVYIDPLLKDYTVPFAQRSASGSLRTISRGSKVKIPEGDTLRFFTYWKGNMVDIDLSSVMYDENWQEMEYISYTNLKSSKYRACHSGDITSAPNGASEFIDLDIPSLLKYGGRYIIMVIFSYSGELFSTIEDSICGWMIRQHPGSGEIFDAKTVQDRFDLNDSCTSSVPVIFDLKERKMIYTDFGLTHSMESYSNINVESNMTQLALMGQSVNCIKKTNLYELFSIHAEARGELVKSKGNADIIFSIDEGVTPFDIDTIAGEYI